MEPMTLFVFTIIFWFPSIALGFVGFSFQKGKLIRKFVFILSLICFLIPPLILLEVKINEKLEEHNLVGLYYGKDDFSNAVLMSFNENNGFTIRVDECNEIIVNGRWHYVREYDAFMLYTDPYDITIRKKETGEFILYSDIQTDCTNLDIVFLKKE